MRKILGALCFLSALAASPLTACHDTGTQDIWMSPDTNGARRRSIFVTDSESINFIVRYSTGRKDLTIRSEVFATRLQEDPPDEKSKFDQLEVDSPEVLGTAGIKTTLAFHMTRAQGVALPKPLDPNAPPDPVEGSIVEPWPVGDFLARAYFDDEQVGEVGFSIVWADCPKSPPKTNTYCRQFLQKSCAYGEAGAAPLDCVCGVAVREQKWTCTRR